MTVYFEHNKNFQRPSESKIESDVRTFRGLETQ